MCHDREACPGTGLFEFHSHAHHIVVVAAHRRGERGNEMIFGILHAVRTEIVVELGFSAAQGLEPPHHRIAAQCINACTVGQNGVAASLWHHASHQSVARGAGETAVNPHAPGIMAVHRRVAAQRYPGHGSVALQCREIKQLLAIDIDRVPFLAHHHNGRTAHLVGTETPKPPRGIGRHSGHKHRCGKQYGRLAAKRFHTSHVVEYQFSRAKLRIISQYGTPCPSFWPPEGKKRCSSVPNEKLFYYFCD